MDSSPETALEFSASAPERVSPRAYWRLLRSNRNFRRLWFAQIVSELGDWFYTVTLYTLLLQFTGRAQSVGLALVLQVLPQTLVEPSAGVVNDRVRRKRVMITADIVRAAVVLSMLLVRSRSTVFLVYPLLVMETIFAALFEPARNSVIPNIVRRGEVIVANTLSSITWSFNLAIGASLGGIVAVFLGREAVFHRTPDRKGNIYRVYVEEEVPNLDRFAGRGICLRNATGGYNLAGPANAKLFEHSHSLSDRFKKGESKLPTCNAATSLLLRIGNGKTISRGRFFVRLADEGEPGV